MVSVADSPRVHRVKPVIISRWRCLMSDVVEMRGVPFFIFFHSLYVLF